jgi:uroporphyrin-III C-methyltransferase
VTAAAGCAAYAGIPLTHRDHAQAVAFATGHLKDGTINLDWPALARPEADRRLLHGRRRIAEICRQMIAHGLPASHPAAVVQTRHDSPAAGVDRRPGDACRRKSQPAGIKSPALIIVGTVVRLHDKLAWFQPPSGNST